MTAINRSTLSATQLASVDALIAANGDYSAAATALGVSKDALRGRVRRMPYTIDDILGASSAPAKPAKSASKPSSAPAPSTAGEVYTRKDGPVKILTGGMREISVQRDHPGAVAAEITKELGGKVKATKTGLRLFDSEGRTFATVLTGKNTADFYVRKVDQETAESAAKDLGDWSSCWPNKDVGERGCARLVKVAKVTKTLIRTMMKLHATHSVDRRTKEHRSAA